MTEVKRFLEEFDQFYRSFERNKNIETSELKMYVRKGIHCVRGQLLDHFIDIANVEVFEENKGTFTTVLKMMLEKYPNANFFIESVLNPKIEHIAKKFNFKKQIISPETYNLYLLRKV